MNTKKVRLYVDLPPGWQDQDWFNVYAGEEPGYMLIDGYKRVAIDVELPCFGGSAEVYRKVPSSTKEIKVGFNQDDD